jgi:ferritin-like metal-binding protein YciE
MSDTPRTNAFVSEQPQECGINQLANSYNQLLSLSRTLERELTAALAQHEKRLAELNQVAVQLSAAQFRIAELEADREKRRNDNIALEEIVRGKYGDKADQVLTMASDMVVHLRERITELERERDVLRAGLKKANDQTEHFEREWYLRGDELETLRADAERYRWLVGSCRFAETDPAWDTKESLDAAIDKAREGDDGKT